MLVVGTNENNMMSLKIYKLDIWPNPTALTRVSFNNNKILFWIDVNKHVKVKCQNTLPSLECRLALILFQSIQIISIPEHIIAGSSILQIFLFLCKREFFFFYFCPGIISITHFACIIYPRNGSVISQHCNLSSFHHDMGRKYKQTFAL